jgi:hypothetical protein
MAAVDTLNEYLSSLTEQERTLRRRAIDLCGSEMLAARSEDARLRIVHAFIRDIASAPPGQRNS